MRNGLTTLAVVAVLLLCVGQASAIPVYNAALGGTASQINTGFGGAPGRAIDGNTNGNWGSGSVTHTNSQMNSWWEVDLNDMVGVTEIKLFNRSDCCGIRLSNFRVSAFVGAIETFGQDFYTGSGSVPQGGSLSIPMPLDYIPADRVRVQILGYNNDPSTSGRGFLSLAEVQVWAVPEPTTMALLAFGGLGLLARRRRKS